MVAIAPAPFTRPQKTTGLSNQMQEDDKQANVALEILQQPPETWYKDQFGRKATFELRVQRTEAFCAQCVEQRILTVKLLYESGKVVEKQEILHVMAGQCLDNNRQSTMAMRINQVSKNHLNQRFCVEIAVPTCPGLCEYISSVVSKPVLVLSKKKKKKRTVMDNEKMEASCNVKKIKRSLLQGSRLSNDLPGSLHSSASTATITGNVTAVIADIEETIPLNASDTTAPFTPETPNICLWANAAFDLLYKLQWQRTPASTTDKPGTNLEEILAQALSKAYKCPSCQETYGQVPTHQDDCDLKLLLEQGGHTDASAIRKAVHSTAHHPLQWSSDKYFERPDRPKVMYSGDDITLKFSYNLAQSFHQLSGPVSEQEPTEGCTSTAVAENLSIGLWKDYASLSKLLYSTTYEKAKSLQAGTASNAAQQWAGLLAPVGILSPGFSALSSSTNSSAIHLAGVQPKFGSQRFSALLSAKMDMFLDAAEHFREGKRSLHGDGNIVDSLGSMNLSELIRSNSGEIHGIGPQFTSLSSSLSALLSGYPSTLDVSSENCVQIVMGSDFLNCGFPALDASFNLVGFYHLVTKMKDSPAELRFAPNLFPLPDEMLQELKNTITKWKENQSLIHRLESVHNNPEDSLTRLKSAVLRQVMR
ncbi:unnamed protein product [Peronospora farinosa]|uniref:Uncharacterized protein n=1 Tax=Peronospora farinosa TaxID=134698 RepID=A0AAV0SSZ3_9STRA|nr:unnamed protein product [Peronospora farinosa]